MKKILSLIFLGTVLVAFAAPKGALPIISAGKDGRLAYELDSRSNRVPDFSTCGYAGGDRQIPDAPVRVVIAPKSGDETARIQQALDYVATLPLDANGVRGAVLLLKGRHEILGGLQIKNSGVVLRGAGAGEGGTVLFAAGLDRRTLIRVVGRKESSVGKTVQITDDYVPVGANSFHVSDASGFTAGSTVRIVRPSTQVWIDSLGANDFRLWRWRSRRRIRA